MGLGIASQNYTDVISRDGTGNPGFVIYCAALVSASEATLYKRRMNPMGDESRGVMSAVSRYKTYLLHGFSKKIIQEHFSFLNEVDNWVFLTYCLLWRYR